MSKSVHSESDSSFSQTPPLLQLLAGVTVVFLLAFGADILLQRVMELFFAGIVEQDAFFYSVVRQQDAFAQNLLELIKLLSFLAIGVGFAGTLIFFSILFFGRSRSTPAHQFEPKQLLKTTLLSLRRCRAGLSPPRLAISCSHVGSRSSARDSEHWSVCCPGRGWSRGKPEPLDHVHCFTWIAPAHSLALPSLVSDAQRRTER